jgi:hypothetical protein
MHSGDLVLARDMSWMELSNVEELSAGYGVLNVAAMQRCAHSKLDPIGRLLCTIWFTPPMAESASPSRNELRARGYEVFDKSNDGQAITL